MRFLHASMIVAVLTVCACTPVPKTARHTVDQYRADETLRDAMLARCANDPGTLGKTPDCINAKQAERLQSRRSLRDIPPVGLQAPDAAAGMKQVSPEEIVVKDTREGSR